MGDPDFSESSFGFRPNRSAGQAAKQVQDHIRAGYRHCVDMNLSKFFDRVQHDVLLARVAGKVRDKRLLRLIGRYLRAGVMVGVDLQPSVEGTMQGCPLSPLLANILLDDFDKELVRRGHHFVRYADDFLVFTKTSEAARRVYVSVSRYLRRKLKLVVNRQKSRICSTDGVEFVGFVFVGYGGQIRVSPQEHPEVQGPRPADHASQPRRVDGSTLPRTPLVFPRVGGLLPSGANQEFLQRDGQVGPPLPP